MSCVGDAREELAYVARINPALLHSQDAHHIVVFESETELQASLDARNSTEGGEGHTARTPRTSRSFQSMCNDVSERLRDRPCAITVSHRRHTHRKTRRRASISSSICL